MIYACITGEQMKYDRIVCGRFVERPNRFIAYVEIEGQTTKVHVKNTGRCKELLQPGATVFLEHSTNSERSTAYDLVAVKKGDRIINMDSQAPNKAVEEWLRYGNFFGNVRLVRPETTFGNSRFDFYVETDTEKLFVEVKGVTLENNNVVSFPDAPSERAVKHVEELIQAKKAGYRAVILFVVQMKNVRYLIPNRDTHPEFADALYKASQAGVEIIARDCAVTEDTMTIQDNVQVYLRKDTEYLLDMPEILLKWYDGQHRILPWREFPTPYRVWVSEIMLQQTRVEAVKPYFERFIKELPTIEDLAKAQEEKLLKLWEGLGYYNRVRNLQKAAVQIMEEYNGVMPSEYSDLIRLAGIGSYTAGAISSIAFGNPIPAVDGNVLRVLSRVRMDGDRISDAKTKTKVEEDLKEIMPLSRPGDFNQAMMEIGACVCLPNGVPLCDCCPLAKICKAHQRKEEVNYPLKKEKAERKIEKKTLLIVRDENRVAIHKRDEKGLLAGLYEFPMLEGHCSAKEIKVYLEQLGIRVIRIRKLVPAKHIFSHKEWHMTGYMIRVDELAAVSPKDAVEDWIFIEPSATKDSYPIPSAFSAYTKYLDMVQGKEALHRQG